MRAVAVVPAAGAGERFGGAKLATPIAGVPLIERTVASLRDGGVSEVVLVVGPDGDPALEAPDVRRVVNRDPSRGMFSSIQAGIGDVVADAILVLPGDMPFVTAATVRSLLRVFEARPAIVSPRHNGKRGHPVVLPGALRDEILAAPAGATLHSIIAHHRDERVDLDVADPGVLRDVDRREDLDLGDPGVPRDTDRREDVNA